MTESSDYESVQVFIGVDVCKDIHHAVAVNRLFDKALSNDENKLRTLISDLKQHGQILLVVDQPATIGALLVREGIRQEHLQDGQRAASPIYTPVKPKPTPVMLPSSPRPPVPCLMHYAR